MTKTEGKTDSNASPSSGRPHGAPADYWVLKTSNGPLSSEDARAFNQWLTENPENEEQFRLGQQALQKITLIQQDPRFVDWSKPSIYEHLTNFVFEAKRRIATRRKPIMVWGVTVATALVACVFAVIVYFDQSTTLNTTESDALEMALGRIPVATDIAEVREEILPDGSTVTIGAASAIEVAFSERRREVRLIKGEAYFDVEPDKDRPFLVDANGTLVRVLGTEFNVSLEQNAVDIAVSEGRVEIIKASNSDVINESDIKHVLTAGQRVTSPSTGRVEPVKAIEIEQVASWRHGELVWIDTPIFSIIEDLNRYSKKRITLSDPRIGRERFTLGFQATEVNTAPYLIAESLGLDVLELPNDEIVLQ